jgi:AcrR family transcriptional regulator
MEVMSRPARGSTRARPNRRRDPRVPIEDLLDAALRVLDRDGLEGLTMRHLADEVGIGVMTLYGYVRTKDELLGQLGAHALARVAIPDEQSAGWPAQIALALRNLLSVFKEHPGMVDLLVAKVVTGPALNHVRDRLLGILIRAGFNAADAVDAFGALVLYTFGFAVAERTRHEPADTPASGLVYEPLEEFPYLRMAASEYSSRFSDRAFELGLGHLLEGLRRQLELQQPAR